MSAHDRTGAEKPLRNFILFLLMILMVACDPEPATPTPVPTIKGAIPPSATVAAALQQVSPPPGGNVDAHDFTPGAVPTANGSSATITPSPIATQASITVYVPTTDLILFGSYYPAAKSPAPALLLLHSINDTKARWGKLPSQLQAAGFAVLAIDLRGSGDTGGLPDWTVAPRDVAAALSFLRASPGIDPARVSLIGAGIGANLAISVCATESTCKGVVAISPRAVDQTISARDAIKPLGKRPLLILVGADDDPSAPDSTLLANSAAGDHRVQRYPGKQNGIALLDAHPDAAALIVEWLGGHS